MTDCSLKTPLDINLDKNSFWYILINNPLSLQGGFIMARITIGDIPKDREITPEDMKRVMGGGSLDDMIQKMDFDLMQAQQRYTQAFQMISGLMKSFHDTSKSIIQNLR